MVRPTTTIHNNKSKMETLTTKERYTKYLKYCHGNKKQMLEEVSTQLEKYQAAKNQAHPEVIYRIKKISDLLEYAESQS